MVLCVSARGRGIPMMGLLPAGPRGSLRSSRSSGGSSKVNKLQGLLGSGIPLGGFGPPLDTRPRSSTVRARSLFDEPLSPITRDRSQTMDPCK